MKKFNYLILMLFASVFFIVACEDDGDVNIDDTIDSDIVLNLVAPAEGALIAAGGSADVSIAVTSAAPVTSVKISLEHNGEELVSVVEDDFLDPSDISLDRSLDVPNDIPLGDITVKVSVIDENEESSEAIKTVRALPAVEVGKTTVLVATVPELLGSDDRVDIYAVGAFQGWDVNTGDHPLLIHEDKNGVETHYVLVDNAENAEFKFVRSGGLSSGEENDGAGWNFVQKGARGEELSNNQIVAGQAIHEFTIGSWRDYVPQVPEPNVPGFIVEGIPTSFRITANNIQSAPTTGAALATLEMVIRGEDSGEEVYSESVGLSGDSFDFESDEINSETWAAGQYIVELSVIDADGVETFEPRRKVTIDVYPCDAPEGDVAEGFTRVRVRTATTGDEPVYLMGTIGGVEFWGTPETAQVDFPLTKLNENCYYIDVELQDGDFFQVIKNGGYSDWWKGQATNTACSDATAGTSVSAEMVASGEIITYFTLWRDDSCN